MNKNTVLLTILCVLAFTTQALDSKIDKVTVYLKNAKIERSVKTNVSKGEDEIILTGLSGKVDQNTIQVRLSGVGVLLSAEYQLDYLDIQNNSQKIKSLQDSLAFLQSIKSNLESELEVYNNEKSVLLKNDQIKGLNTGFKVEELKLLLDFQRQKGFELNSKILDLETKLNKNNARITQYQIQIYELNANKKEPSGKLILKIMSSSGGSCFINFEYLVNSAGWTPIYDLRVDNLDEPVNLVFKANVFQNTGVEWNNVNLVISTGNPSLYEEYPVLNTLFSSLHNNYEVRGVYSFRGKKNHGYYRSPPPPNSKEKVAIEDKEFNNVEELEYSVIEKENQLSTEYEIYLLQDITSNGKSHLVNISSFQLGADFHYYAVPKMNTSAYLLADIYDWYKYDLLSAEANIFVEGAFIGKTFIDPNSTADTLSVSLGTDRQVQIERKIIIEKSGSKIVSFKKKIDYAYAFKILNNKKQNITVEILDQIPVANNEEIEVSIEQSSEGLLDAKTGEIQWNQTLKPGESISWDFIYSVKYPKGKNITGTK